MRYFTLFWAAFSLGATIYGVDLTLDSNYHWLPVTGTILCFLGYVFNFVLFLKWDKLK